MAKLFTWLKRALWPGLPFRVAFGFEFEFELECGFGIEIGMGLAIEEAFCASF